MNLQRDLNLISGINRQEMDQLFISTQPAHLQKVEGNELDPNQRDIVRAEMLRKFMKHANLKIEQE